MSPLPNPHQSALTERGHFASSEPIGLNVAPCSETSANSSDSVTQIFSESCALGLLGQVFQPAPSISVTDKRFPFSEAGGGHSRSAFPV